MIGQMRTLLRVKELKESQAFRAKQLKRQQRDEGQAAAEHADAVVRESASTLASREDAIYADILGAVVPLDRLDDTRGRVVALEQDHGRLVDARERANHVLDRLDKELDATTLAHRAALKQRDTFALLTDDLRAKAAKAAERKTEGEVEELFTTRRKPAP